MIRVLYVSRFDRDTSADGLYSDELTRELAKTGEVEVIRGPIQVDGGGGLDGQGPSKVGANIAELARNERAELVHIHYEPGLYSPRAVLSLRKAARAMPPLIVTLHRVPAYYGRLKGSGIRQFRAVAQEWLLAPRTKLILVHAEHSAAIIRKRYPKVRCEAHAMPVPDDDCNAPRKAGGPVLYYGNHHPGKGILEFVRAMRATPDLKAIVAGRRHERWAKYNALVQKEVDAAPNITLEDGWTTSQRKHELFREASAVALPYLAPGSGSLVLQEAIAHERPVVASMTEPLRSLVAGLGVGLTVDTHDAGQFGEALRRVATQNPSAFAPELARAREANSGANVAKVVANLYQSVVAGG